jgi:signal peptide peptidase SppA
MTLLTRIAERVINRPLMVHPDKLPIVLGVLQGRIPLGDITDLRRQAEANIEAMSPEARAAMLGPSASRFVGEGVERDSSGRAIAGLPYKRTSDGIGIVTVTGSLINRGAWVGSSSGETSYEGIKFQVASAAADPKVRSILLDIESPGGEAVGAFEAADAIRAAAKLKPVTAVVNGMAASAAYALASAADKIVTTQTGMAGSIGVVMLHADYSRMLDAEGITPTLIFSGSHKVDGNPFEPLSDAVLSDLQAECDNFYNLFVKTVSAGRKGLSPAAIRGTEAKTFLGKEAVDRGLADSVGTFESTLADISRGLARTTSIPKGKKMDQNEGAPAAAAGISLSDHTAAVTAATNAGKTEGAVEAGKAAQARIKSILGSDEAKGRAEMANHLAFETDMSAEASIALLAKSPKGEAPKAPAPSIQERQDLALGGVETRRATKIDPAELNAGAIYDGRRKARGSRVPSA